MSKVKHYRRNRAYWGYKLANPHSIRGSTPYDENIREEIRHLEKKGDIRKVAKLRGYLNKSLYSRT